MKSILKSSLRVVAFVVLIVGLSASSVSAELLVKWDFESDDNPSETSASMQGTGMSSSGLNLVDRYDFNYTNTISSWVYGFQAMGAGADTSAWTNDYIEFTVSSGSSSPNFTIESIDMDPFWIRVGDPSRRSDTDFYLLSSDDGFASSLGVYVMPDVSATSRSAEWSHTYDLSSSSLAGKKFSTITFRLYALAANYATTKSINGRTGFDNLTVNGHIDRGTVILIE